MNVNKYHFQPQWRARWGTTKIPTATYARWNSHITNNFWPSHSCVIALINYGIGWASHSLSASLPLIWLYRWQNASLFTLPARASVVEDDFIGPIDSISLGITSISIPHQRQEISSPHKQDGTESPIRVFIRCDLMSLAWLTMGRIRGNLWLDWPNDRSQWIPTTWGALKAETWRHRWSSCIPAEELNPHKKCKWCGFWASLIFTYFSPILQTQRVNGTWWR